MDFIICWRWMMRPMIMRLISQILKGLTTDLNQTWRGYCHHRRQHPSMLVVPTLEALSSLDSTCSDINQSVTGVTAINTFAYVCWKIWKLGNIWKYFQGYGQQSHRCNVHWKIQLFEMALEGQALQLVQGLPIVNENYWIAWDLLVDRYEQ